MPKVERLAPGDVIRLPGRKHDHTVVDHFHLEIQFIAEPGARFRKDCIYVVDQCDGSFIPIDHGTAVEVIGHGQKRWR